MMQNAKMNFVAFDAEDVIETSGMTFSWTGLADTTAKNAKLFANGKQIFAFNGDSSAVNNTKAVVAALNSALGIRDVKSVTFFEIGDEKNMLNYLVSSDNTGVAVKDISDSTVFEWVAKESLFRAKQ